MCDRIENSDRTGTDRIGIILAGTGPDCKPEKVNRIRPDWPDRPDLPDFYRIY